MTSLHWAELRFRVPLSRWSAISSAMKVLRSTSWRPFLRRLGAELALRCVGEPGAPERILILAMAPLRPVTHTQVGKHMKYKCLKYTFSIKTKQKKRAKPSGTFCSTISVRENKFNFNNTSGHRANWSGSVQLKLPKAREHFILYASKNVIRYISVLYKANGFFFLPENNLHYMCV